MNPFSTYNILKSENLSFKAGSLIVVGSPVGQGKSSLINSMILNYIENNIDVLVFSENIKMRDKIVDAINQLKIIKEVGEMYYLTMIFSKPVERFINTFREFLAVRTNRYKNFVIIFDGPMFEHEQTGFDFFNLNSNTRRVLVEKFTKKNQHSDLKYEITEGMTQRQVKHKRNHSLKNFSAHFNSHIVLTEQLRLQQDNLIGDTEDMQMGDVFFTVRKNAQHNFDFSCIKNRFGADHVTVECALNRDNLSLELVETKNNLHF